MTSNEKLYLAIGEIDDSLIEEASKPVKRTAIIIKRIGAIAACFIIGTSILLLSKTLFKPKGDMSPSSPDSNFAPAPGAPGDGKEDESVDYLDKIYSDFGCLEQVYSDGVSFEFNLTLDIALDQPIEVYLYSKDGKTVFTTKISENDSEDTGNNGVTVLRPTILIGGVSANSLPKEAGRYRVSISFDGLDESEIDWNSYFHIDGFGPIKLIKP
jgi:hypothetical protein